MRHTCLLLTFALLTACAVGPDYVRPDASVPAAYKEHAEGWKEATPQDTAPRGAWWTVYQDPALDALMRQVVEANQSLKAAEASYRAAQALVEETRASLFPTLNLTGSAERAKARTVGRNARTANSFGANAEASWAPDLWGRLRRTLESDRARAEASAADLAAAQLSLEAELATHYFDLRTQDEQRKLLEETVAAYERSLTIAQNQYEAGIAARADVVAAQTQLESTQAQLIATGVRRAQLEHAIAVLIGKTPAELTIPVVPWNAGVPTVPAQLPSALLERRPDIASAERAMAAANAQIGVATAAYFPDLTLTASAGYASTALSKLFQASNSLWALGANVAETVFDAGARQARVDNARALYDQSVAQYRQTVLTGFQQVEDQLAALRILARQAEREAAVVASAREAERLVLNQYQAGIVPYSSVITAQTAALNNQQTALSVRRDLFTASVALIQALGGGWERPHKD